MGYIQDCAENRMNALHQEIISLDREINRLQNDYNSLIRFKGSVYQAQGNFNVANDHRRLVLRDLDAVKNDNTVVQKYQSGMGDQLTGIGMFVVDASFYGLLGMIDRKLASLSCSIEAKKNQRFFKEWEYNSIDILV